MHTQETQYTFIEEKDRVFINAYLADGPRKEAIQLIGAQFIDGFSQVNGVNSPNIRLIPLESGKAFKIEYIEVSKVNNLMIFVKIAHEQRGVLWIALNGIFFKSNNSQRKKEIAQLGKDSLIQSQDVSYQSEGLDNALIAFKTESDLFWREVKTRVKSCHEERKSRSELKKRLERSFHGEEDDQTKFTRTETPAFCPNDFDCIPAVTDQTLAFEDPLYWFPLHQNEVAVNLSFDDQQVEANIIEKVEGNNVQASEPDLSAGIFDDFFDDGFFPLEFTSTNWDLPLSPPPFFSFQGQDLSDHSSPQSNFDQF